MVNIFFGVGKRKKTEMAPSGFLVEKIFFHVFMDDGKKMLVKKFNNIEDVINFFRKNTVPKKLTDKVTIINGEYYSQSQDRILTCSPFTKEEIMKIRQAILIENGQEKTRKKRKAIQQWLN